MIFPVMIHAAMIFPVMILAANVFPQAGLATAFHVPKAPFVTKNAPSPLSTLCDPRSRIRRAFSKREFIKGKPFTQLLPTFCPLFISPCKYLPCQAFVIQNVFFLHRQLEGEGVSVSTNPVSSQLWTVLPSMLLTTPQQSLEECMLTPTLHNMCFSFSIILILPLRRVHSKPPDFEKLKKINGASAKSCQEHCSEGHVSPPADFTREKGGEVGRTGDFVFKTRLGSNPTSSLGPSRRGRPAQYPFVTEQMEGQCLAKFRLWQLPN